MRLMSLIAAALGLLASTVIAQDTDEDLFMQALDTSGYNLSSFDGNVTDMATRLVIWTECDATQKRAIYSGWQQSWKIMDVMKNVAYNWDVNEAAHVEYLGPPAITGPQEYAFREIYENLATIKPSWIPYVGWRIHIRCDDPGTKCPCETGGSLPDTIAYTVNRDPNSGLASINFCPRYFIAYDLDDAMKNGNDKLLGPEWYANVDNYLPNKARVWIHELFHIDWVSGAGRYGREHITDVKLKFQVPGGTRSITAYNPWAVKALAKFNYPDGAWIIKNSDSLSMFAMAQYIQKALGGIYPHLPFAGTPPDSVDTKRTFTVPGVLTVNSDGITTVLNETIFGTVQYDPQSACSADVGGDPDATGTNSTITITSGNDFDDSTLFPAEYLSLYNSWLGGTSWKTTGRAPSQPVKPGTELRILCVGDSITVGYLSDQNGGDGNGYRLQLLNDLSSDNVTFVGTVSAGTMPDGYFAAWSGKTIKYISDHVGPSLEQRPNIILLHAGTNDMNPNPAISTEGNDPQEAANRLGSLIDQMITACPDATILVAMIINTCDPNQEPRTQQYQSLIPGVVQERRTAGHSVAAVDFTTFPTSLLQDCIHPTNEGYHIFGDYWYDFIGQIPSEWINLPIGPDPEQVTGIGANGGLDTNVPPPDWGTSPVQPGTKDGVLAAANTAGNGGRAICNGLPVWQGTGQIALGLGHNGPWQYQKNWVQAGKIADGLHLDPKYVRLHDMNGDGKADYIWLDPNTGEIICWLNNLPSPWSPAGTNNSIIGSGAGPARSVFLADMNGDGLEDYMVVNPNNGAVHIWWNYGPDDNWDNGWKFVDGGQIASGVPHANWATLRFPDINGDGRADYVYIGAGGSLGHWLNTGSPGGQDVVFIAQGGIASGAAPDITKLVFADMNGDGRDDYLIWDDQAGLTGFLNQPTNTEGVPFYVNQGPAKTVADGITQDPSSIRLADMDGDGKDDYAYIDQDGAIWLWYNQGMGDTSMDIDGIRFADIDGDGIDDYIWLDPATGAPTVYINKGPNENDGLGWSWSPLNGGSPIASGAAPAADVKFGDIDGDGKDDYLVLDPKTGELSVYLNAGPDPSFANGWRFNPIGSIASGLGPGANARFADIDGDGFDDYIFLHPNGGTTIYRNVFNPNTPLADWVAMPDADASGIGQRPEEIQFYDINGDGKADYIWTRAVDGASWVWLNNYPNQPTWLAQPQIAGGVGTSGSNVRYATLQNTGRASYVAVNPSTGAIAAWLNGCNNLGPAPPQSQITMIELFELYNGVDWEREWIVFDKTAGSSVDVCNTSPTTSQTAFTDGDTLDYPTQLTAFKAHGHTGCTYSGTVDAPGTLSCPGLAGIRCEKNPQYRQRFLCDGGATVTPVVLCKF